MKSPRVFVLVALLLAGILLFAYSHARSSAKSGPTHSVTLKWAPSAGATSYNVYRSAVSGGPYAKIGVASTPTYVDTPVPSGAVFYYVVTAVQNQKESAYSREIKASVP